MAEAGVARPRIVGETLNRIGLEDGEVLQAVLEVMETERLLKSGAEVDLVPAGISLFANLGGGGDRRPLLQTTPPPPLPGG
jgi:hypothetical protein